MFVLPFYLLLEYWSIIVSSSLLVSGVLSRMLVSGFRFCFCQYSVHLFRMSTSLLSIISVLQCCLLWYCCSWFKNNNGIELLSRSGQSNPYLGCIQQFMLCTYNEPTCFIGTYVLFVNAMLHISDILNTFQMANHVRISAKHNLLYLQPD